MPYKTVKILPKLFMTYKGIKIYHCYEDGDIDYPYDFYYTTDIQERPRYEFPLEGKLEDAKKTIRKYIDQNEIDFPPQIKK